MEGQKLVPFLLLLA